MTTTLWLIRVVFVNLLALSYALTELQHDESGSKFAPGIFINITVPEDVQFGKVNFYQEFHLPPSSLSEVFINLEHVQNKKEFGFAIVQVHGFLYNVLLSVSPFPFVKYENGTNLGVTVYESGKIFVLNPTYHSAVQVAVVILVYSKIAPIPGGCNFEAGTLLNDSAMLSVSPIGQAIQVDAPLASESPEVDPDLKSCRVDFLNYEFYYRFLLKGDLTAQGYFSGIRGMLEVDNIKTFGSRAGKFVQGPTNRRKFIAVAGSAIVVNVLVTTSSGRGTSSTYIPTVTYSCHPLWRKSDCHVISLSIEWVIPAILFIIIGMIRIFIVLQDHTPSLFVNAFSLGSYLAFCLVAAFDDLEKAGRVGIVLAGGLGVALFLCAISTKLRATDVALDITSKLIMSWIVAVCILFLLNDNPFFAKDWIYWSTFFTIVMVSFLSTLPFCKIVPIVAYVCTGVNAILLGVQILLRSNMLLIILTHLYRIKDASYRSANGVPKASAEDIALFVAMPAITALGIFFQIKRVISCGRARRTSGELTPIHTEISRWGSGSDEVFVSPQTSRRIFRSTRKGYRPFN